jgi:beta-alanine--pyruvate transaminase
VLASGTLQVRVATKSDCAGYVNMQIVEPVSGSTGVLPPPVGYLKRLREICDKHNILLIFDEVITGFGRLGETFATKKFDVNPDMITCAKGLTNAAVPCGAVISQEHVFKTIQQTAHKGGGSNVEMYHGYTYR